MANKMSFLISVSLKRKILTKWFFIANGLILLLVVSLANIDTIITFFGGDFDRKQEIYIIDKTAVSTEIFGEQLVIMESAIFERKTSSFEIIEVPLEEYDDFDYEEKIAEDSKRIVIIIDESEENYISATVITEAFLDTLQQQIIVSSLNSTKANVALLFSDIDTEELAKINMPITIERIILDEEKESEEELQATIMTTVFPFVILPFFMLSLFLVQMIGAEVNDEKTTRGMEIIISSVSPKIHFFSKVIAGNLFIVLQGFLLLLFGGLAFYSRKLFGSGGFSEGITEGFYDIFNQVMESDFGAQLVYIIPLTIILMLLTFLAYSLLAGILASMTTNIEDFQQVQAPIIIISLVGYYLAMLAGVFAGATFIKVFSFVPLISAILSPSLLVLEQIGIMEVVISILIMIAFNYLLIKYGLKVYKVGILNYSTKDLWKKMFKALKT